MPAFDYGVLGAPEGAVLYLQDPAPKDLQLAQPDGVVSAAKSSRALVVRLEGESGRGADDVLDRSARVAQEAPGVWAVPQAASCWPCAPCGFCPPSRAVSMP